MQTPWVERPSGFPSIFRHGQIGSQLHDSKYLPRILQLIVRSFVLRASSSGR